MKGLPLDFYELIQNHIALFLLLLSRNSGIFIMAPFFGGNSTPIYVRAGFAFVITLLLFPMLDERVVISAPETILMYGFWFIQYARSGMG